MSDFSLLKKSSKKSFADLAAKLEKETSKTFSKDDRYWTITRDAAGNGSAVIRFLPPAPEDDENYYVKVIKNYTKGPTGKYYNELSRANLGREEKDPYAEYKSQLWNASDDENSPSRKAAKALQRKQTWHSNIYVVKDPAAPENEGKVFLFSYGKTVFDMIQNVMFPIKDEFEEKEAYNPFDFWDGANFVLRVYKDGEWASYDKSNFTKQSVLIDTGDDADDNKAMERIWRDEHKLSDLISADKLKSYDDLKKKLYTVLELDSSGESRSEQKVADKPKSVKPHFADKVDTTDDLPFAPDVVDNEDDVDIAAFKKMMEES